MEKSEPEAHRGSNELVRGPAGHMILNVTPKERIRSRIRRRCSHSEVNVVPSVAEALVRIASIVMLIALCLQAIHR